MLKTANMKKLLEHWNHAMRAIFPTSVRIGLGMPLTKEQEESLHKSYPKKGELWCQHDPHDPFPPLPGTAVTILDVKDGWVRYGRGMSIYTDERLRVTSFVTCYVFHKAAPAAQPAQPCEK